MDGVEYYVKNNSEFCFKTDSEFCFEIGFIYSILENNSSLYIFSNLGVFTHSLKSVNPPTLTIHNPNSYDGYISNDSLWLISDKGLHLYDLIENEYWGRVSTDQTYNRYSKIEMLDNALFINGTIEFKKYNIKNLELSDEKSLLRIEDVFVDGQRAYENKELPRLKKIDLGPEDNYIRINYSVNSALNAKAGWLSYRIEDVENTSHSGSIEINTKEFGTKNLTLIPYSPDGIMGESKIFEIHKPRPYYQTWWFISSSILGLIGIGFSTNYMITIRKLKAAQIKIDKQQALSTQREKIADDLHDELGTELNKILYLSDEAIENPSAAKSQELLAKIGNLAISSIHNMRDILWVLDDRHNSLRDLSNKIKSSINKTLAEYPINNTVSTQWAEDATLLESNQRQQLLLIIKESINNAIKHSQAQQIHVKMGSTDRIITIEITDDGVGFDNPNSNGRGLSSMRKRANSIDAELHINSTVGVGTTIKIEAPIIDN